MRPTPRAWVWLLLAALALLAVCAEAGGKRKKIVVFVPQKVKHIHHHHVKKVYVKKHKPVEYIEELDEDLHRAGEGGEDDHGAAPSAEWGGHFQDGDDKVLAASSEHTHTTTWGKKTTPGSRAFLTHVGRSGEQPEEGSDPGVVSAGGWTALVSAPSGPSGPEETTPSPRPGGHHDSQYDHHHDHHHGHHQHKQHSRGERRPAEDSQQGSHHHHHHHHQKQHKHQVASQHRADKHRDEHRDEHGVPDDIREWVKRGYEKYHGPQSAHSNNVKPDDDIDVLDDVRVQVFEDGKEVPTTVRERVATTAAPHAASSHEDRHHRHHQQHPEDHHRPQEAPAKDAPAPPPQPPQPPRKESQLYHRQHASNRRQSQQQRRPQQRITPPNSDPSSAPSWESWRQR